LAVVVVQGNEPPEKILKRFKRLVDQEQILTEAPRGSGADTYRGKAEGVL